MGKKNNVILHYLSDKNRFADLINAEVYDGRQVIDPEKLIEISATTYEAIGKDAEVKTDGRRERRGDLAMRYEDGSIYRIFLGEAQNKILYTLPVKNMEYVAASYKKQLSDIIREHKRRKDLKDPDELLSGIAKYDRLKPIHLIWLYHGEKTWDGPRCLKDLMDFGDDRDGFSRTFNDFVPHLLCINEMKDAVKYRTELRKLMEALRCVSDKERLKSMVVGNELFESLDEETFETALVLLNRSKIWNKRKKYMKEGGKYDMCKAFRDWEAEIVEEKNKELEKKEAQLEQQEAQLEQKDALIDSLEKENAILRAKLEAAGL